MANVQVGYGHSDVVAEPFDFYVPLTGFTITMQTAKLALNPAGTLATGTVNLPLNPPDGALAEISSTQVVSALTVSANTGDSIVNGVLTAVTALTPAALATAGSASATIRYRYSLNGDILSGSNKRTWLRIQ
jgi:hypothetical protein